MIADFGLARSIEQLENTKKREYTNCVVTRWYRPPEILLGNRRYGTAVDMWGIGCVIAEMFKGGPILTGNTDINQCELIFKLCGSPTAESMPGWESLPGCEGVRTWATKPRRVRDEFFRVSPELADLLDRLLVLDPTKRLNAEEALDHDWFWTDPIATDPAKLPHYEPSHEYDRRKKDDPAKKSQQQQIASFTGIQNSAKVTIPKLAEVPPSLQDPTGLPSSGNIPPPPINGGPIPPTQQTQRTMRPNPEGVNQGKHGSLSSNPSVSLSRNPYASQPSNTIPRRDGADNYRHLHNNSHPPMPPPIPSGPPHSRPGPSPPPPPPPTQYTATASHIIPPVGGPSNYSHGPASFPPPGSLPMRPGMNYERGGYDNMAAKAPMPMMNEIGVPMGGGMMAPYGHPSHQHFHQSGHPLQPFPEPYMGMPPAHMTGHPPNSRFRPNDRHQTYSHPRPPHPYARGMGGHGPGRGHGPRAPRMTADSWVPDPSHQPRERRPDRPRRDDWAEEGERWNWSASPRNSEAQYDEPQLQY